MADDFKPGIYTHYKGGMYTALMLVRHHETRELLVLYVSHKTGNIQVRELRQPEMADMGTVQLQPSRVDAWTDVVEWQVPMPDGSAATHGPRFVYVGALA